MTHAHSMQVLTAAEEFLRTSFPWRRPQEPCCSMLDSTMHLRQQQKPARMAMGGSISTPGSMDGRQSMSSTTMAGRDNGGSVCKTCFNAFARLFNGTMPTWLMQR